MIRSQNHLLFLDFRAEFKKTLCFLGISIIRSICFLGFSCSNSKKSFVFRAFQKPLVFLVFSCSNSKKTFCFLCFVFWEFLSCVNQETLLLLNGLPRSTPASLDQTWLSCYSRTSAWISRINSWHIFFCL